MNTLPPRLIKVRDSDYLDANSILTVTTTSSRVDVFLRGVPDEVAFYCDNDFDARALADRIAGEVNIFSVREVVPDNTASRSGAEEWEEHQKAVRFYHKKLSDEGPITSQRNVDMFNAAAPKAEAFAHIFKLKKLVRWGAAWRARRGLRV